MPLSQHWNTSSYTAPDSNHCVEAALVPPPDSWRTSSYSQNGGQCVEVADAAHLSAVRDTKNRGLGALLFPTSEWRAFVDSAKRDSF
ncbi:DUF397 domain-containing protein [Nocardiopsis coralliicola]